VYCPNFCVVKSVNNYTSILSKTESRPKHCDFSDTAEPCALEFLVHFTGDIHQPLHVGYDFDAGGNGQKVVWFGQDTNLHSVWDTKIIQRWVGNSVDNGVEQLTKMINDNPALVKKYLASMDPTEWADESFGYVRSTVYDFGSENGKSVPSLGEAYYKKNLPVVQQRLIAGGLRLGQSLNTVLRTPHKSN